jgi:hypothetical protein
VGGIMTDWEEWHKMSGLGLLAVLHGLDTIGVSLCLCLRDFFGAISALPSGTITTERCAWVSEQ